MPSHNTQYDEVLAPPAPAPSQRSSSGEHQTNLFKVLWRRKWIVLTVMAISLAGAQFYISRVTPQYTSRTRLYVQQTGPRVLNDQQAFISKRESYLYIQSELIRADETLSKVLEKDEIAALPSLQSARPLDLLRGFVRVELDTNLDTLAVNATAPHPEDAAKIATAVVDAYIITQGEQRRNTSTELLKYLTTEKDKQDKFLRDKLAERLEFRTKNGDMWLDDIEKGGTAFKGLTELAAELSKAKLEHIEIKVLDESAQEARDDRQKMRRLIQAEKNSGRLPEIESDLPQLRDDYKRVRVQLRELQSQLGVRHTQVKAAAAKLDQIAKELEDAEKSFIEEFVQVIHQQTTQAVERVNKLQAAFDDQRDQALKVNSKSAAYAMIEADINRIQKLCDALDDRIKELNIAGDAGPLNITIVEGAKPIYEPSEPKRDRAFAMAGVLGMTLGLCCALLIDWMDKRLRTMDQIKRSIKVRVLGGIPRGKRRRAGQHIGRIAEYEPTSPMVESYRAVRTAVHLGMIHGRSGCVLVTSPHSSDGKTVTASNLAITLAQAGHKTLLVDADLRNPMQAAVHDLNNEIGLSNVLTGRASVEEAIQRSTVPGLDIMPSGPPSINPSELFASRIFNELFTLLKQQYDYIVIDSPPVLPVTDACILSVVCDATVLVIRVNKSTQHSVETAVEAMNGVGATNIGIVVNELPRSEGYYGSQRYSLAQTRRLMISAEAAHKNGNGNGPKSPPTKTQHAEVRR